MSTDTTVDTAAIRELVSKPGSAWIPPELSLPLCDEVDRLRKHLDNVTSVNGWKEHRDQMVRAEAERDEARAALDRVRALPDLFRAIRDSDQVRDEVRAGRPRQQRAWEDAANRLQDAVEGKPPAWPHRQFVFASNESACYSCGKQWPCPTILREKQLVMAPPPIPQAVLDSNEPPRDGNE